MISSLSRSLRSVALSSSETGSLRSRKLPSSRSHNLSIAEIFIHLLGKYIPSRVPGTVLSVRIRSPEWDKALGLSSPNTDKK